jgi:hypothetical protein
MCEECEAACAYMDYAAVRDIAFELGRRQAEGYKLGTIFSYSQPKKEIQASGLFTSTEH